MEKLLPSLRNDIEVMPSPAPEQPGLLLRDPYHYTGAVLIVPPVLVPALAYLDGTKTGQELLTFLIRHIGHAVPAEVVNDFVTALDDQGFLKTAKLDAMRESQIGSFREATERHAVHSGSAYPSEGGPLSLQLAEYMQPQFSGRSRGNEESTGRIGIAAPHVSPAGGWKSYGSAYAHLTPALGEKTFVVLGTSHYGQPERFGLTRKPFVTPLGTMNVETALVDWLEARASDAIVMEDYCHSIEHSIEFQCLFLQHMVGPQSRILPILCGPFLDSLIRGKPPESDDHVRRFVEALGELAEREGERLFWVLGIDLAHIGRRYGDAFAAFVDHGHMVEVKHKDRERLERVCAGDRAGFFELVKPQADELRWCGYSPLYTFLNAVPGARGNVVNYEQWNIDEESVVSFAAMEFFRKE